MLVRSKSDIAFDIVNYTILIILGFFCLYPFLYMVGISFNEGTDTLKGGVLLWPRKPTLTNYASIFRYNTLWTAYRVTILKTIVGTVLCLIVTSMVAYGMTEKKLPFRNIIGIYILIPMFISGGMIPEYINLVQLHLTNTFFVYVVPGMFSIWNFIIMRSAFQSIPESLKESMRLDGANEFQVFIHIVLPLSKPTLAALGLFLAVGQWIDWFAGAFYVNSQGLIPVQTLLMQLMNQDQVMSGGDMAQLAARSSMDFTTVTSYSIKLAGVVVGTVPILCIYPFLQKYFVKGVMIGSIKG